MFSNVGERILNRIPRLQREANQLRWRKNHITTSITVSHHYTLKNYDLYFYSLMSSNMLRHTQRSNTGTGQTKRWAIGKIIFYPSPPPPLRINKLFYLKQNIYKGTWLHMPASHRFDLKARAAVKRGLLTTQFGLTFGLVYPLLGGLFFQSGIMIQALLIPVFFCWRACYEYVLFKYDPP